MKQKSQTVKKSNNIAQDSLRQHQVLDAAVKRFSHFGIAKTTMTELAEDLSVTKQALSYYFHDKPCLVNAVLERISREYSEAANEEIQNSSSVEDGLARLTQLKSTFFEKYYMLFSHQDPAEFRRDPVALNWKHSLRINELNLLVTLFENGVRSGELKPLDAAKTAELLLETLYAFSKCVKRDSAIPDANAFKEVLKKQHDVMKLFYDGLKLETWQLPE